MLQLLLPRAAIAAVATAGVSVGLVYPPLWLISFLLLLLQLPLVLVLLPALLLALLVCTGFLLLTVVFLATLL